MTEKDKQLLQKVLKDAGYSITNARLFVCELLWDQEPQSMHDLGVRLDGTIDRASLYRTVTLFEKLGIVHRIYMGWKYKVELSDIFAHHHHHISCTVCGKIVALREVEQLERMLGNLARKYNFEAQSHQLEIQGVCEYCRRKQKTSR